MSSPSPSSSSDPVVALRDTWRGAREAFRFSSVCGRAVTGTHLLRISGYSTVEATIGRGGSVDSAPFRAGGHRWKLSYYPGGFTDDSKSGCAASACLWLLDSRFPWLTGRAGDATATYTVSILDHDGNRAYSRSSRSRTYRVHGGTSGVWMDVLKEDTPEKRKEALLPLMEDDGLVVRCDVTVQRLESESRFRWFLRRWLD